jgi:hypothetical protein
VDPGGPTEPMDGSVFAPQESMAIREACQHDTTPALLMDQIDTARAARRRNCSQDMCSVVTLHIDRCKRKEVSLTASTVTQEIGRWRWWWQKEEKKRGGPANSGPVTQRTWLTVYFVMVLLLVKESYRLLKTIDTE